MRLPKRDIVATALVALAATAHLLWVVDATLPGLRGARATGLVILLLGFAASASAVVPRFEALLHGSKAYLATTSLLGVVALVAGIQVLVSASEVALGVLMAMVALLWLIATVHHVLQGDVAGPAGPVRASRGARTA